jgi:hypothetical protein
MRRPVTRSCLIALTALATAGHKATAAKTGYTSATFTEKVS